MRDLLGLLIVGVAFTGAVFGVLEGLDTGNPFWLLLSLPLAGVLTIAVVDDST
jgi:hypothetical protein